MKPPADRPDTVVCEVSMLSCGSGTAACEACSSVNKAQAAER